MPIDRLSGGHDASGDREPGGDAAVDQPVEAAASAAEPAKKRQWLDLDNEPTERLLAFLGLDRTERVSGNDLGESSGRRSTDRESPADSGADQRSEGGVEDAGSAPELTEDELRHCQDQVLPPVENPRERGKPTTAAVFDETGFRGLEVSGRDDLWSDLVEDWIDEYGWLPSRDRIETHVEAKVVAKMVRGELPEHITLVLNNVMCAASDPRVVSCRSFADESLLRGMSLRVYNNDGSEPLYIEGNA